jgi:hypothetical protein
VSVGSSAYETHLREPEQIRRAVNLMLFVDAPPTTERLAAIKKSQEIIAATGGPAVLPHWTEHKTILSGKQAQEIAQKIGKPMDELFERVPAQENA